MPLLSFERQAARDFGAEYICGCDEAGRGPLAGPVVAAAVYIPVTNYEALVGVTDSKQLSARKRAVFFEQILMSCIVGIGMLQAEDIDTLNIYAASRAAMLRAIRNLQCVTPVDYILTDAMPLPDENIRHEAIIKGDQKSLSIAAASIIAKQVRDQIMLEYDKLYPMYHFGQHKGYGTKQHLAALATYGVITGLHRMSYKPVQAIAGHVQGELF
jgi:ribonuclease HII